MNDMEFIEHIANTQNDNRKTIMDMRTSSRARVIWNVGIAGFALLNAKSYWEALAGTTIIGINNAWLSLPWILSTFFGVITYFLIDETVKREQLFFVSLFNAFDLFKIDVEEQQKVDVNKLKQITKGEDPSTIKFKKEMEIWRNWTRRFELLTITSLVAGFIWSVIGPLILK